MSEVRTLEEAVLLEAFDCCPLWDLPNSAYIRKASPGSTVQMLGAEVERLASRGFVALVEERQWLDKDPDRMPIRAQDRARILADAHWWQAPPALREAQPAVSIVLCLTERGETYSRNAFGDR